MKWIVFTAAGFFLFTACNPKIAEGIYKNDLRKDVAIITSKGTITIRLSDSTPLHRNNFIKLVKKKYYDSILFHRVIKDFMIQAGDPNSKNAKPGEMLGNGGPATKIPSEFKASLFHKKGALGAARDNNPEKASSGSQFYLVQGKIFSDAGLDSVETYRLNGNKIPAAQRAVYKTIGGTPHLDGGYTVFGEIVDGLQVVDSIAVNPTSGRSGGDRPLQDIRIIKMKFVKRK
jgi:peptidyl-prolyl cis-trans isomerase B (cyclophilin B)